MPTQAEMDGLFAWLASVRDDPYAFSMGAFPWGVEGTALEAFDGPMPWSCDLMERVRVGLIDINTAIQEAVASGHGIAKSATVAMLILWAFFTFPDTRGVVTANTETQLKTKTWAELGKWFNLCWFARDHFVLNATSLISKDQTRERTWRIDMVPWSEKNTEAFAGLHNKGKRLILVFDEASAIPDIIWETADGALTDADTQIMWFAFGNPTKSIGRFRDCFADGSHHDMWHCTQIDSREVPITNKTRIEKMIKVYGEDSDRCRIRILGQFPKHGEMEFFSAAEIDEAMSESRAAYVDISTPLALGVDVARFGINNSVIFPRKGRDARSIPREVFHGLNTVELSNKVFSSWQILHPDGIFIDGGGVGGGVVDQCRNKQLFVFEIQFGGKDDITGIVFDNMGEKYANKRAAMYGAARAWCKNGMLPNDQELRKAMLSIKYIYNKKDEIQLIAKEDILEDDPDLILDDLDAFVLTFGGPLAANANAGGVHQQHSTNDWDYHPFDIKHMEGEPA